MNKIVLYSPRPWSASRPSLGAPLALLAISSLLEKEGYNITVVSDKLYENPIKKALDNCRNAICLGITAMTGYQITGGLELAKLVRQQYPRLPIVWGGRHPTIEPEGTIRSSYVDILVRGQGERTFTELVHALKDNKPLDNIAGLSYKVNNKVVHNVERPLEDLNNFPPMPYFLIDTKKTLYSKALHGILSSSHVLNYVSSTGCAFRCGFCSEQTMCKRKWLGLEGKRVANEVESLVKTYGVDVIDFRDPNLFVDTERIKVICKELIKKNLRINWTGGCIRIPTLLKLEEETWDLMKESGCIDLFVGAESGYQPSLDFMQKDLKVEETIAVARRYQHEPVKICWSMLCGLPWKPDYKETKRLTNIELEHTLTLAEKLIGLNNHNSIVFRLFTPYPGCPLYTKSLDIGLLPPNKLEDWSNWILDCQTTPWVSPKQAEKVRMLNHIFSILDPDFYNWISSLIRNKPLKLLFRIVYGLYKPIVRFRLRHRFFTLFIGYQVYTLIRKKQTFT